MAAVRAWFVLALLGLLLVTASATPEVLPSVHPAPLVVAPPPAPPADPPPVAEPSFALPDEGRAVARVDVDEIVVRAQPTADADEVARLDDESTYGFPRVLLVVDHRTSDDGDWLEVLLPVRPNGTQGWVHLDDVAVETTTRSVHVSLSERRVEVREGTDTLLATDAVVGSPSTPTPTGTFFVTDPIDLQEAPSAAYGVFILGVSGYSDVFETFAGGLPQIAIHGTQRPDLVGQAVSNGCVRVPNDVVVEIAGLVDLGTPVYIEA